MDIFRGEQIWRVVCNFWTIVLLGFLFFNFISKDGYSYLTPAFSVIYTGVLSLYVGTKEFDRWYEVHESRHPGEVFIGIWTAVVFFLYAAGFLLGTEYKVSSEVIADYIMVLSVFAVTQKSKKLHSRRHQKRTAHRG